MCEFTDADGDRWEVAFGGGLVFVTNRAADDPDHRATMSIPAQDADMLARLIAAAGAAALRKQAAAPAGGAP